MPTASVAIENPSSVPAPPIAFAQTKFPEASNFEIKISETPLRVKLNIPAPGSKSAVPLKDPIVNTFPEASIVIS